MNNDDKIKLGVGVSTENTTISAGIQGDQQAVNQFFAGITPDFIKDGVGILSDQMKLWRWKNQVEIIKKAQAKIKASGLPKQQIPLKVLVPIIQNSALEEEPLMQEKWANMLANAATGNVEVSPNYAAILNELSPIEASILDKVYKEANGQPNYTQRRKLQFNSSKLKSTLDISDEKADLIIENLYRLNLLQAPGANGASIGGFKFALRTTEVFEFTNLGYMFVKSCSWSLPKH